MFVSSYEYGEGGGGSHGKRTRANRGEGRNMTKFERTYFMDDPMLIVINFMISENK